MARFPSESDERWNDPEIVELAVEKKPFRNPSVVEVLAPYVWVVNGFPDLPLKVFQSVDERHPAWLPEATLQPMVKPDPIMYWLAVAVIPPELETVPVATDPKVLGVPLPVQNASCPIVGTDEVPIAAVMVAFEPPTREPKFPLRMMPPPEVTDEVATDWRAPEPAP